jgi:O-antigen/teichoic acid export membrane protein
MNSKSPLSQLVNNSLLYSISVILVKAGHLVLLPFLLTKLTLKDFGIIGLCQSIGVFISPMFEMGMSYTIQRLFYDWDENKRWKYISAIFVSCLILGFSTIILLYFIGQDLFKYLIKSVEFFPFLFMVSIISFFNATLQLPISVFRITEKIKNYNYLSLLQFSFQCTLILYFVFISEEGALGYYKGILGASFIGFVYSFYFFIKTFSLPNKFSYYKNTLKFGLPMVPSSILENFSSVVDRIVLEKFVTLEALGVFTLARQIGYLVGLANIVLKQSFVPQIYRMQKYSENFPNQLAKLSTSYISILSFVCIGVIFLIGPILELFAKQEYMQTLMFVPVVALSYLIHSFGTAYGRGYDLSKTNRYFVYISAWTLVSNLLISVFCIYNWSLWGAFASLLLASISKNIVHIFLAYRAFPRPTYIRESILALVIPSFAGLSALYGYYNDLMNFWINISLLIFFGLTLAYLNRRFFPLHLIFTKLKNIF